MHCCGLACPYSCREDTSVCCLWSGLTFPISLPLLFIQIYFSLSAPLMRTLLPNVSVSTMSLAVSRERKGDLSLWLGGVQGFSSNCLPFEVKSKGLWQCQEASSLPIIPQAP